MNLKVVHINTYSEGGAAKAAIRLHNHLLDVGIHSCFVYMEGPSPNVVNEYKLTPKYNYIDLLLFKLKFKKHYWDKVYKLYRYINFDYVFSRFFTDFNYKNTTLYELFKNADIIHLHWVNYSVCSDFVKEFNKKIVYTLHDMNLFTGGCHYSYSCSLYEIGCKHCPLVEKKAMSIIEKEWKIRKRLAGYPVSLVVLNNWMYKNVSRSVYQNHRIRLIPNALSIDVFKKIGNSPNNNGKPILGMVVTNHTKLKGYELLVSIVNSNQLKEFDFVYIGKETNQFLNAHYKGWLTTEEELVQFYNNINVLIVPSEADNQPNVIVEAISCGVSVIASAVGGIPELINTENGVLVPQNTPEEWIRTIKQWYYNRGNFDSERISINAHIKYNSTVQTKSMLDLYKEVIL